MPLHLAQMNYYEQEDPVILNAPKYCDFDVAKLEVPFTKLFVYQSLEQKIKMLKRYGGMVEMTKDEAALV